MAFHTLRSSGWKSSSAPMYGRLPRNVWYCASERSTLRPGIQPSDKKRSYLWYLGSDARSGQHMTLQFRLGQGARTPGDGIRDPEHGRHRQQKDHIVEVKLGGVPFRRLRTRLRLGCRLSAGRGIATRVDDALVGNGRGRGEASVEGVEVVDLAEERQRAHGW